MTDKTVATRIIAALDLPTWEEARPLVQALMPRVRIFKVGITLFVREGRRPIDELHEMGAEVFLDLKLHDIPMQVAGAAAAAAALGVRWLSLHTSGGERMLREACEAVAGTPTELLGISVLTSLDREDLAAIGVDHAPAEAVALRARLAAKAGLHGLVCSPLEIALAREALGPDRALVTPGIRLDPLAAGDDQKRVLGPAEALRAGASHLVMGRALVRATDPGAALARLEEALADV